MSGAASVENSGLVRAGFLIAGCVLSAVFGAYQLTRHLVDHLRRR